MRRSFADYCKNQLQPCILNQNQVLIKMTGSPVFKFNSHQTKKQRIQRKLNFVRDVPRNQLKLHIDNLVDSDRNSDSQDEKVVPKPATKSFSSLSSFVFENKKGVKRKLDFDGDEVSDEVSSFRFSNHNISLNGFHSRNSSMADVKSVTISPSKNLSRRNSCTRSSIASTCRRRLFADAEPEMKKARLESPVLCPKSKNKEIKLSLQKRFPGVPNSDTARSGLLLNLAFSKYNMFNNDKEKNVSVDFMGEKNSKSSTKKELQYSSIKKDSSSFHFSPVFKAIKRVKRKLDLEDDAVTKLTNDASTVEMSVPKEQNSVSDSNVDPQSTETNKPSTVFKEIEKSNIGFETAGSLPVIEMHKSTGKGDFYKNLRLRPSLRNEILNLSKPGQEHSLTKVDGRRTQRRFNLSRPRNVLTHCSPLACVKTKSKCDRIIVNKEEKRSPKTDVDSSCSKNTQSAACRSAKRWFDDSFYKGKNADLRKSLFHRRQEAFVDSHIQRFLNDCAQAAELGVTDELTDSQGSDAAHESAGDEPASRIEDVESPVRVKVTKAFPAIDETLMTNADVETGTCPEETSPVIQLKKKKASSKSSSRRMKYCENVEYPVQKETVISSDFIIEDSTSQEINKHCVEEVELFIENGESQDGFAGFRNEDSQLVDGSVCEVQNFSVLGVTVKDNTLHVAIEEESTSACSQKSNLLDPDLLVEEISSSESISEELHFTEPTEESSTPSKDVLESNNDETFDSAKKRRRKKYYSDDLAGRLERLICREKSDMRMWEYEMSKRTEDKSGHRLEPAVFRVQKMWKEFSRLILQCTLATHDQPDKLYEVDEIKKFGVDVTNSVILIMELSTCPKTLTYSSIFRVHPPWNIFSLEKYDCVVILRPSRMEVISKDDESPAFSDSTLPNVLKERQFCACSEACDCALPEGYQTVIQPLLYSSSSLCNFKTCRWKTYDEEYFKCCRSVSDAVLKHKLFPSERLFLNLHVLYVKRNYICNECVLWHCVCVDEVGEVCCVVVEDEMKNNVPIDGQNELLWFYGILPWKVIPAKTVPSFFDHIDVHGVPEIESRLGSTSLYIFVLSRISGKIERVV